MNIKEGMIIKVENFKASDMPDHWVISMTAFSGKIFKVTRVDESRYDNDRIYLKDIYGFKNRVGEYYFHPGDFIKANTLNVKSKRKHAS